MNKNISFLTTTILSALLTITVAAPAMAQVELLSVDNAAIPAADTSAKSNVYIVMMKDDPAVAYEGNIKGYKATKPGKGAKINPNSAQVKKYTAYLDSTHDKALSAVGAGGKIYSYHYALNGFAAVLSKSQVEALRARDDVVRVWQDEIRQPTTDSTPNYLGLKGESGVWALEGKGENVIVGIIDTGIWPEHASFSDQNDFSDPTGSSGKRNLAYGPPPESWSGSCQSGEQFSQDDCNNKLIGARYYPDGFSAHGHSDLMISEYLSPRDSNGHGSHTASTAAGNEGPQNTINSDPVSGVAPRARIAVYKVCWNPREGNSGCAGSDSAAAIDQAVADGVDVINFSIGGGSTVFAGPDDIAFLFAADAGVFVATSNGNAGPGAQTTGTPAGVPWITAVGATQDDQIVASELTVNAPESVAGEYDSVGGASDVTLEDTGPITADVEVASDILACGPIEPMPGKIALVSRGACTFTTKFNNAAAAGAIAIVVYNSSSADPIIMLATGTSIPGVMIRQADGQLLAAETGVNVTLESVSGDNRIAEFSSRGPNGGAPDVIKPDVAAPGVNIIAAGAGTYSIAISGTSMASPHVAGAFALLKEAHPDWSAAMAKSALMTSARQNLRKTTGNDAADPFDIGAGHIVPAGAFAPGLVYDASFYDYLAFTCDNNVQLVSDGSCAWLAANGYPSDGSDLNLASIGVANLLGTQTVTRTVTSMSPDGTTFTASVDAPAGVDVVVTPDSFTLNEGDSQEFTVEFTVNGATGGEWAFGGLTWNNDSSQSPARSPIAVKPMLFAATPEVDASGTDGSVDIDVQFGYTGDYAAIVGGIQPSSGIQGNVSADEGLDVLCGNLPPLAHLRFATFDEDTTTPGADDIDIRLFYGPDCSTITAQLGGSGGVTSEEVIDVFDAPAGAYWFVIDYYAAASGSDIDYTAWIQPVGSDNGNTVVTAPASAVSNTSGTVTVDYAGLDAGTRHLGVVHHVDGDGEIARTIIDIDTQ